VFELGLGDTGATLAAWILTYPLVPYIATNENDGTYFGVWLRPPYSGISPAFQKYIFPMFAPRFPYGWDVSPDAPL